MKTTTTVTEKMDFIAFDLDVRDVITVVEGRYGKDLYLRATFFGRHKGIDDAGESCIARMSVKQWDALTKDFFSEKSRYSGEWGCGVACTWSFGFTKLEEKRPLLMISDEETKSGDDWVDVNVYALDDVQLEMERG